MPTLYDPEAEYDYVLSTDRDKPKEEQVKFKLRVFSKRQWSELAKIHEVFKTTDDNESMLEAASDIVKKGLVSWSGWKANDNELVAYNERTAIEFLDDALTLNEFIELMIAVIQQGVTDEDKKKSNSQSDLNTESSKTVKTVQDNDNAKASQLNTNQ